MGKTILVLRNTSPVILLRIFPSTSTAIMRGRSNGFAPNGFAFERRAKGKIIWDKIICAICGYKTAVLQAKLLRAKPFLHACVFSNGKITWDRKSIPAAVRVDFE